MDIIKVTDGLFRITSSEGHALVLRGDSSGLLQGTVYVYSEDEINDVIEVNYPQENQTYIPKYDNIDNIEDLNQIKYIVIQKTKDELTKFLEENPLFFNDKYYSVTELSQSRLLSIIAAAEFAHELGMEYTPLWNEKGEELQEYDLKELKKLFVEIQKHIVPYVQQQQNMEKEIWALQDKISILNYNIFYSKMS